MCTAHIFFLFFCSSHCWYPHMSAHTVSQLVSVRTHSTESMCLHEDVRHEVNASCHCTCVCLCVCTDVAVRRVRSEKWHWTGAFRGEVHENNLRVYTYWLVALLNGRVNVNSDARMWRRLLFHHWYTCLVRVAGTYARVYVSARLWMCACVRIYIYKMQTSIAGATCCFIVTYYGKFFW